MNCQHCGIEIPPNFTAALKSNVCPACSKDIMSDEMKGLISGLAEEMTKNSNPEAVACWLASNYKMTKVADYNMPAGLTPAKPVKPGLVYPPGVRTAEKVPTNTDTSPAAFLARAGIKAIPTKNDLYLPSPVKPLDIDLDRDERQMEQRMQQEFGDLSQEDRDEIKAQAQKAFESAGGSLDNNPLILAQREKQRQAQDAIASGFKKPGGFCRSS